MKLNDKNRYSILSNKSILIICLAAVLLLAGTGYSYWSDKLIVTTNVSTGYCDLAFTHSEVIAPEKNDDIKIEKQNEHDKHNHGDKHLTDIGNRLHIHIKDATPNKISFTVTNFGTAPAVFNTKNKVNQDLGIEFANFTPQEEGDKDGIIIIAPNSSRTGEIILTYTALKEKNYNLLIDLECVGSNKYEFKACKE